MQNKHNTLQALVTEMHTCLAVRHLLAGVSVITYQTGCQQLAAHPQDHDQ